MIATSHAHVVGGKGLLGRRRDVGQGNRDVGRGNRDVGRGNRDVGRERGSAVLVTLFLVPGILALGTALIGVAAVYVQNSRAETATDLAALSAATQMLTEEPCPVAAHVLAQHGVASEECRLVGRTVVITAAVTIDFLGRSWRLPNTSAAQLVPLQFSE